MTKRTWTGKYTDIGPNGENKEYPFRIDVELNEELSFTGKALEDDFYQKSELYLTVKGFIHDDHINFIATYPCFFTLDENFNTVVDKTKGGHSVYYDGYWNENLGKWEGFWEVKGQITNRTEEFYQQEIASGPFEMSVLIEE